MMVDARILAIDTATEVCSVALLHAGTCVERLEENSPQASRVVLDMLDELLRQTDCSYAEVDVLAFGHGPGSFTGVRVATGLVQGLALGHGLNVIGISTLAAIASNTLKQSGQSNTPVLATLDARMNELYWGCYQSDKEGILQTLTEEKVGRCEDIQLPCDGAWLAAGSAGPVYSAALSSQFRDTGLTWIEGIAPRASVIAALALQEIENGEQGCKASEVRPVYLRHQVVHKHS